MRTVLILLLLANLSLFAYTKLDAFGGGDSGRLPEQVRPDKIRILSAKEVAALGPAKVAALADVCLEWGPLGEDDRARALAELAPLGLGTLLTQKRVEVEGAWSPALGAFPSRAAADRRLAELRDRGYSEVALVETGAGQFGISLGAFRTEQAATARADALGRQGLAPIRVIQRAQTTTMNAIVVRDPPQPVVLRMKELQMGYAGSELRVGTCEKGS